jgi:uncharacterized membrane protein YfcA
MLTLVLSVSMAVRDRSRIHFRGVGFALVGYVPGAGTAGVVLLLLAPSALSVVFAGMVLAAVFLSAVGISVQPSRGHNAMAGAMAGLMGTITSIGGPPLALLYQNESGARVRGTLGTLYIVGAIISISVNALAGRLGADELVAFVLLLPGTILGFVASSFVSTRLDRGYTRPAILVLSSLSAVGVLLDQLF